MKPNWNPITCISDWGWVCIMSIAGLLFAISMLLR